jgi:hypothetical protein
MKKKKIKQENGSFTSLSDERIKQITIDYFKNVLAEVDGIPPPEEMDSFTTLVVTDTMSELVRQIPELATSLYTAEITYIIQRTIAEELFANYGYFPTIYVTYPGPVISYRYFYESERDKLMNFDRFEDTETGKLYFNMDNSISLDMVASIIGITDEHQIRYVGYGYERTDNLRQIGDTPLFQLAQPDLSTIRFTAYLSAVDRKYGKTELKALAEASRAQRALIVDHLICDLLSEREKLDPRRYEYNLYHGMDISLYKLALMVWMGQIGFTTTMEQDYFGYRIWFKYFTKDEAARVITVSRVRSQKSGLDYLFDDPNSDFHNFPLEAEETQEDLIRIGTGVEHLDDLVEVKHGVYRYPDDDEE